MKRLLIALMLTGCANGPVVNVETPKGVEDSVYKKFIGVPVLLSMEGTYVRISDEWVLTATHNRALFPLSDWYGHPDCDIALVKMKGNGGLDEGKVYSGDILLHSGFPIGSGFTSTRGNYLGDVYVTDYPNCQMSASTGAMASGMSGGAVTNESGELVGILHGWAHGTVSWPHVKHCRPVIWTSINAVQDWIETTIRENE